MGAQHLRRFWGTRQHRGMNPHRRWFQHVRPPIPGLGRDSQPPRGGPLPAPSEWIAMSPPHPAWRTFPRQSARSIRCRLRARHLRPPCLTLASAVPAGSRTRFSRLRPALPPPTIPSPLQIRRPSWYVPTFPHRVQAKVRRLARFSKHSGTGAVIIRRRHANQSKLPQPHLRSPPPAQSMRWTGKACKESIQILALALANRVTQAASNTGLA